MKKVLFPLITLAIGFVIGFFIRKCDTHEHEKAFPFKEAPKKSDIAFNEVARFDSFMRQILNKPIKRYRAVTYRADSLMALLNRYDSLKKDIINSSGYVVLGDTSKYNWKVGFYPSITENGLFTINIIPTVTKTRNSQQVQLPYSDNQDYFDFLTHFEGKAPGGYQFPDLYKKSDLYVYDYGTLIP